jgi:hypothetical protein
MIQIRGNSKNPAADFEVNIGHTHPSYNDLIDGFVRHMRNALLLMLISGELRVNDLRPSF